MFLETFAVAVVSINLLSANADCSPTSPAHARVEFTWELCEQASAAHLALEFSPLRDLRPGPNRVVIELEPGTTHHVFEGHLVSNTVYHWRVRTRGDGPSVASDTASFESAACAVGDHRSDSDPE